jgi:hypothetical protein
MKNNHNILATIEMFDQIKTEPMQFYQACPTQPVTVQQHHQVILQQRNQISTNTLHPQTTVITLHENKNTLPSNLNVVNATTAFREEDKISFLPTSNPILNSPPHLPTLVDIKSEIISPSLQSQSHHHLNSPTTPQRHQQQRVIHQNSTPNAIRSTGLTSSTTAATSRSTSKPQACKVCGKILSSASSYYVHLKLHSGSKPFQCKNNKNSICRLK